MTEYRPRVFIPGTRTHEHRRAPILSIFLRSRNGGSSRNPRRRYSSKQLPCSCVLFHVGRASDASWPANVFSPANPRSGSLALARDWHVWRVWKPVAHIFGSAPARVSRSGSIPAVSAFVRVGMLTRTHVSAPKQRTCAPSLSLSRKRRKAAQAEMPTG